MRHTHLKRSLDPCFGELRPLKDLFSELRAMWDIRVFEGRADVSEETSEWTLINELECLESCQVRNGMGTKAEAYFVFRNDKLNDEVEQTRR
jgi:hypothetical protein